MQDRFSRAVQRLLAALAGAVPVSAVAPAALPVARGLGL